MKIAIEGCAHGELDNIYSTIKELEQREKIKIDLLICCGDFQSSRNLDDLNCMAVPPKYRHICSFYKYYSGENKAPILTIFIGGNHEASNYLQELPYGGWVAPNIYYLGYAGVINIAGIRIGGISGIYKSKDYFKGRYEKAPYDENSKRSVYHIRNLDVFRLKQISQPIDIFLSHDWPTGVYNYGNVKQLLKRKPFFKEEIDSNQLGSKPCEELLKHLQPNYWFSAHLHCKFAALVPHQNDSFTKFLALDKCLPRRKFLQVVDIPHDENQKIQINYDLEWLSVLHLTNHLLTVKNVNTFMPGPGGNERYNFTPTKEEKSLINSKLNNSLKVPKNFIPTSLAFNTSTPKKKGNAQPEAKLNPQTVELCKVLFIDDPVCLISESRGMVLSLETSLLENSSFINDSDDSESCKSESEVEANISEQEHKIQELTLPDTRSVTPLKLPMPKNVEVEQSETRVDCEIASQTTFNENLTEEEAACIDRSSLLVPGKDINASPQPLVETHLPSPKRILNEETVSKLDESKSEDNVATGNDSPSSKKFKRRNADIYAS